MSGFKLVGSFLLLMAFDGLTSESVSATFFGDFDAFEKSASDQILIDFSEDANGTPLSNAVTIDDEFADFGVLFSSLEAGYPWTNFRTTDLPSLGSGTYSGGNFIQLVSRAQGGGELIMGFSSGIFSFGVWLGDFEPNAGETLISILYSDTSMEVASISSYASPSPLAFSFFGVVFDSPVQELRIRLASTDYVLFDDISFSTTPAVPLPAAGLSLVLGLLFFPAWKASRYFAG